jgi:hypothetical protein
MIKEYNHSTDVVGQLIYGVGQLFRLVVKIRKMMEERLPFPDKENKKGFS